MMQPPSPGSIRIGHGRLERVPRPDDVDVDHRAELLLGELPQEPVGADAGVCDDDVEAAELRPRPRRPRPAARPCPSCRPEGDDPASELLDELDGLGEVVLRGALVAHRRERLADVDGDDVGALLGQPDRLGAALTPCRTRDERDFALEPLLTEPPCDLLTGVEGVVDTDRMSPARFAVRAGKREIDMHARAADHSRGGRTMPSMARDRLEGDRDGRGPCSVDTACSSGRCRRRAPCGEAT